MLLTFRPGWDEVPRRGAVIADAMARAGVSCEPARAEQLPHRARRRPRPAARDEPVGPPRRALQRLRLLHVRLHLRRPAEPDAQLSRGRGGHRPPRRPHGRRGLDDRASAPADTASTGATSATARWHADDAPRGRGRRRRDQLSRAAPALPRPDRLAARPRRARSAGTSRETATRCSACSSRTSPPTSRRRSTRATSSPSSRTTGGAAAGSSSRMRAPRRSARRSTRSAAKAATAGTGALRSRTCSAGTTRPISSASAAWASTGPTGA